MLTDSSKVFLPVAGVGLGVGLFYAAASSDDAGVSRIDLTNEYFRAARDYGLGYPELKAIARNSLTYSFLDDTQKRDQLERFERRCAEFERSVASRQSPLSKAVALIKAAVTAP